jgi:hypothetical protein
LVAAVVPALLAAALADVLAALDAAADDCAAAEADCSGVDGVCDASVATATAEGSSVVNDVGSVATAGTPPARVCPLSVATAHAAARMPADVATAAAFPRTLTS